MKRPVVTAALLILLGVFGALAVTSPAAAKTLTYKGSGDGIIKTAKPSGKPSEAVAVSISHNGSSNFVVWALNKNLKQTDLLVNTIGDYKGTQRPVRTDCGVPSGQPAGVTVRERSRLPCRRVHEKNTRLLI